MKERLPIALSSAALIVALFGVTPIGSAAGGAVVSLSKLSASRPNAKPKPRVVRGPRGPRGLRGRVGPPGPVGPQGPVGTPDPSSFYTKTESDSRFASQATVAALQARIGALESKLAAVSYDSTNHVLLVTGANVQIVDGSGDTGGAPNGLGNVIVGYNADATLDDTRTGSHNLVIGDEHTYTRFGGLLAGFNNTASGDNASVSGGYNNTASGFSASVSGGQGNTASGFYASVSGGALNTASGNNASVSAGFVSTASGFSASVSGGQGNTASGDYASVSGGVVNTAGGGDSEHTSVSGGRNNTASGDYASVSGGRDNTTAQWLAGTLVSRTANVLVPGGAAGNGDYATRATEAACAAGELLWGGGAFWVSEVNDDEHALISSRANAALTGWSARGGNDTSVDRTLTVQAVCLGP